MFYTFHTKASEGMLTGPTVLTSATNDIHPDPNLTLATIGLRNMKLIQPKKMLPTGGQNGEGREEFFRFRECRDPEQPISITSVVETRRLLTTEELYLLTKCIPITVVHGKSAADICLSQNDAPTVEKSQQHGLKEFIPIYPFLTSLPSLSSGAAPPTPKFFCGGSIMQPQWMGQQAPAYHVSLGGCPKPVWGMENPLKIQQVGVRAPPGFHPFLEQEGQKIGVNQVVIGGQMVKMPGQGLIPNGFIHHQPYSLEFHGCVENGDVGPAFEHEPIPAGP